MVGTCRRYLFLAGQYCHRRMRTRDMKICRNAASATLILIVHFTKNDVTAVWGRAIVGAPGYIILGLFCDCRYLVAPIEALRFIIFILSVLLNAVMMKQTSFLAILGSSLVGAKTTSHCSSAISMQYQGFTDSQLARRKATIVDVVSQHIVEF